MSAQGHTSGPWSFCFEGGSRYEVDSPTQPFGRRYVATVQGEANAALIAAAPDLLAALTRLLDIAEDQTGVRADTDEGEMAAAQRDARTAIAKARGGAA